MNKPIQSLFIQFVELYVDAQFIMDLFYTSDIATIRSITFQSGENEPYKKAYIDIHEWHDTEIAYNFIKRLQNSNVETKIVHTDDDWWVVKINKTREEFYLDPDYTTFNYLVSYENDNEHKNEPMTFNSNEKGHILLSHLKDLATAKKDEEDHQEHQEYQDQEHQDEYQDQEWREIQDLLNTAFQCQQLELL